MVVVNERKVKKLPLSEGTSGTVTKANWRTLRSEDLKSGRDPLYRQFALLPLRPGDSQGDWSVMPVQRRPRWWLLWNEWKGVNRRCWANLSGTGDGRDWVSTCAKTTHPQQSCFPQTNVRGKEGSTVDGLSKIV